MEKVFRLIANSLLTVFLFALMMLPIASMMFMGLKPETSNVLSAQDGNQCVCPPTTVIVDEYGQEIVPDESIESESNNESADSE